MRWGRREEVSAEMLQVSVHLGRGARGRRELRRVVRGMARRER